MHPKATNLNNQDIERLQLDASLLAVDPGILNILLYAEGVQAESKETVQENLAVEMALAQSLVASSAWFALALNSNQTDQRFFPRDWLEPQGKSNPDVIMSCVLCQLANYGHSVIELIHKGLDTPARALLRATTDLAYMLAVLATDRETFQKYVLNNSLAPKEQWYTLFSNKKIAARIFNIDTTLGLPQEWTNYMRRFREENGEFFSEAIHHSYRAVVIGALPTMQGTDRVELAVLGGAPSGSSTTLGYLITSLNYGLTMFLASISLRAEFIPSFSLPHFWEAGVNLSTRTQPIFLAWLKRG